MYFVAGQYVCFCIVLLRQKTQNNQFIITNISIHTHKHTHTTPTDRRPVSLARPRMRLILRQLWRQSVGEIVISELRPETSISVQKYLRVEMPTGWAKNLPRIVYFICYMNRIWQGLLDSIATTEQQKSQGFAWTTTTRQYSGTAITRKQGTSHKSA